MSSPTSSPPPPQDTTAPPPSTPSSPPPPTSEPPPSSPPPPTSAPTSGSPPPQPASSPPPPTSAPPPAPASSPPPTDSAPPPAPASSPPPTDSAPPPAPASSPPPTDSAPPPAPASSPPTPDSAPPPAPASSPPTPGSVSPAPASSPPPSAPSAPPTSPPPPENPPPPSPPTPVTPSPSPPASPPPVSPSPSPPPPSEQPASPPPPPVAPSPTPTPPPSPPPPSPGRPARSPPSPVSTPPPPVNASASPPPSHRSPPPPPVDLSTSPPPPGPPLSSSSKSTSIPLVLGIAAGSVIVIAVLFGLFILLSKRSRRRRRRASSLPSVDPYDPRQPHYSSLQIPFSPTPPPVSSRLISSNGGSGSQLSSENQHPVQPSAMSSGPYTYEELTVATDGFSDANLLGEGGFGQVYRGTLNGTEVAIKKLSHGSRQGDREFRTEIEVISRVHHRNLVSLVGYCIHGDQRLLIYEFVPNKTLALHLHGTGRPTLDWPRRWKIAVGSAKGLAYLHEDCHPKIIHRDIKAANILLDFHFEPKVADFGLAKFQSGDNTHVSTRVMGTFGYMAPEYITSGKLTDRSDVYSFGVMVLELITGRRPVQSSEPYMDVNLVEWARPLLARALEDDNNNELIDPRLQTNYDPYEMARLIACAAAAVRHSAKHRPRMSQIVRYLEGEISVEDLNVGMKPGQSVMRGSGQNASEEVRRLRTMAFGTQDYVSSEQSELSSEYSQKPLEPSGEHSQKQSESSSAADTGELEVQVLNKHSQGLSS